MFSASFVELFFPSSVHRLFGVNQKIVPKLDLQCELVPRPFVAGKDNRQVQQNFETALALLGAKGRGYVVACDETVFFPGMDVITGLGKNNELGFVGGCYHESLDKSFLTSKEEFHAIKSEEVSKLSQFYCVSRSDSNGHIYAVNFIPRPQKVLKLGANSAASILQEFGQVLCNACLVNEERGAKCKLQFGVNLDTVWIFT